MDWAKFDRLTDEEVIARALTDPDNPPLGEDDFRRMKRRSRAYVIRRALRMTQEEFANAYGIPLGTLRDWEQARATPPDFAMGYMQVIARHPGLVGETMDQA